MLPLTFANAADYDRIESTDKVSIKGLTTFTPGKQLVLEVKKVDGKVEQFKLNHTFNEGQIGWFKAGSALNKMSAQ